MSAIVTLLHRFAQRHKVGADAPAPVDSPHTGGGNTVGKPAGASAPFSGGGAR